MRFSGNRGYLENDVNEKGRVRGSETREEYNPPRNGGIVTVRGMPEITRGCRCLLALLVDDIRNWVSRKARDPFQIAGGATWIALIFKNCHSGRFRLPATTLTFDTTITKP